MVSSSPEAGKFFHLSCCKWDQASSGIGIGYDHGASGNGGDAVLGGGEQNIPAGHWKNHWICDAAAIATRRRRRRRRRKRRNGKSVASPVELACFAASKQSTRPRSLRYLRVRVEQEKGLEERDYSAGSECGQKYTRSPELRSNSARGLYSTGMAASLGEESRMTPWTGFVHSGRPHSREGGRRRGTSVRAVHRRREERGERGQQQQQQQLERERGGRRNVSEGWKLDWGGLESDRQAGHEEIHRISAG
ncbi:hypothetical protein AXG93_2742s1070 [Marchantia polymorpha subsp. ruderalis]|uniref:Uncharacterized protein n=1 Tax=Marchantia polymorpha subsp. ruderalis TaxID=1480154 RepID=A0A176VF06_MARPO|nr:hypothetical protein AXG93_2742s1070 [Marchantia polymorpha subsp. ruderalis]